MPAEMLKLHWMVASKQLLQDLHVIFIACLIAVDVLIATAMLGDTRVVGAAKQNSLKIIAVIGIPSLIMAATYQADHIWFWDNILLAGALAAFVLVSLRYWTYHTTITVEPIQGPTLSG